MGNVQHRVPLLYQNEELCEDSEHEEEARAAAPVQKEPEGDLHELFLHMEATQAKLLKKTITDLQNDAEPTPGQYRVKHKYSQPRVAVNTFVNKPFVTFLKRCESLCQFYDAWRKKEHRHFQLSLGWCIALVIAHATKEGEDGSKKVRNVALRKKLIQKFKPHRRELGFQDESFKYDMELAVLWAYKTVDHPTFGESCRRVYDAMMKVIKWCPARNQADRRRKKYNELTELMWTITEIFKHHCSIFMSHDLDIYLRMEMHDIRQHFRWQIDATKVCAPAVTLDGEAEPIEFASNLNLIRAWLYEMLSYIRNFAQTYALLVTFAFMVSIFIGGLLYAFLVWMSALKYRRDDGTQTHWWLAAFLALGMPPAIIGFSLISFNMCYLFYCQFWGISFVRCRAMMMVAWATHWSTPWPAEWSATEKFSKEMITNDQLDRLRTECHLKKVDTDYFVALIRKFMDKTKKESFTKEDWKTWLRTGGGDLMRWRWFRNVCLWTDSWFINFYWACIFLAFVCLWQSFRFFESLGEVGLMALAWVSFLLGSVIWVLLTGIAYVVADVKVFYDGNQTGVTLVQDTLLAEGMQPGHVEMKWRTIRNKLEQYMFFVGVKSKVLARAYSKVAANSQLTCWEKFRDGLKQSLPVWVVSMIFLAWSVLVTVETINLGQNVFRRVLYCVVAFGIFILTIFNCVGRRRVPCVITAVLLVLAAWMDDDGMVFFLLSSLLSVWAWASLVGTSFPKVFGWGYYTTLTIKAVILGILVGSSVLDPKALFDGKVAPFPVKYDADWNYIHNGSASVRPPYPVCSIHWGHAEHHISTIDLAILSAYAYAVNDSSYELGGEVYNSTQQTFNVGKVSANIVYRQRYYKVGRIIATRFVDRNEESSGSTSANNQSKGTTVLAIKGSSTPYDFYVDATFWAMISIFQVMSILVPMLDQMPNQVFALVLYMFPQWHEREIFNNINETHKMLKQNYSHDEFVLTGHSLGGGIAIAAGGRFSMHAIGFSGPGSHFSRWRFGTTLEHANRNGVNVYPEYDAVPKFDRHDELVQFIQCRDSNKTKKHGQNLPHRDPAVCHSITTTICELWRACGDVKRRSFRENCVDLVNPENRGRYLTGSYDRNCWTSWF